MSTTHAGTVAICRQMAPALSLLPSMEMAQSLAPYLPHVAVVNEDPASHVSSAPPPTGRPLPPVPAFSSLAAALARFAP